MTRTSLLVALLAAIAPASASAATRHVTTTADSGAGSLRQAIIDAQAAGPDDIVFDAGGRGTIDIGPTQLPVLTADTTVTGTKTGGVPDVELHCTDPSVGTGLQAFTGETGVIITGLSITNCTNGAFALANAGLTVRGSWIGRSRAGTADGNTGNGVGALAGAHVVVGGPSAGDGNVITANLGGVGLDHPAPGALVEGNAITGSGQSGVVLLGAPGVVVRDNVVSGNGANGIILFQGQGAVIQGNRVGTNADGTAAQPNAGIGGINLLGTTAAKVGGAGAGEGNVVGAGAAAGACAIVAQADGAVRATGTVIAGNRVGTTASGLAGLAPGGFSGICDSNTVNSTIGGTAPGAGNVLGGFSHAAVTVFGGSSGTVIEGNTVGVRADGSGTIPSDVGIGVALDSPGALVARNVVGGNRVGIFAAGANTHVQGNLVGLAQDGRTVVGNEQGIQLDGAAVGLQVGDGTPAGANVVSGNTAMGVLLNKTAGAVVAGNTIGRTADGIESRPNGPRGGIQLLVNAGGVVGGDAPGAANVIDGGPNASVRVEGDNQLGTRLLGNVLRGTSGGGLGIDLYPVGVTANDAGDADTGPNGLQNEPVVTVANPASVTGTIGTKASTSARSQVFAASADGREALALLGDTTVTTDAAGAATFSIPVSATVGGSVVATATTGDGTSELSAPVTVTAPVAVPVFGLKGASSTSPLRGAG